MSQRGDSDRSEREGAELAWEPLSATATKASDFQLRAPAEPPAGTLKMMKKREKMEMPVCTRVSLTTFRALEVWCDNSFRKRSEVVGMVLERIVDILSQQQCIEQPVEEVVRRLRITPRP